MYFSANFVSVTFYHMCVHINLSWIWVAECPPFEKELLTRLTIGSLCALAMCGYSSGRFDSWSFARFLLYYS